MTDLLYWWQHLPENISPVIFEIGWFRLQYYGLMYLVAFAMKDMAVNMILGVIIGGRLGYVVFYNPGYYLRHPLEIILPFAFSNGITFTGISGMSFHGGLICLLIAAWLYIRKAGLSFREMADLFAPAVPLGYTFGRIGNFINGELYGRITTSPIGMQFPQAPGPALRHPSQLYEAFFEGIFLFAILWLVRKRPFPRGAMLSFFLIGYGTVRFFIEYFRQPDDHLGFVWLSFSMGQVLCGAMVGSGVLLFLYFRKK